MIQLYHSEAVTCSSPISVGPGIACPSRPPPPPLLLSPKSSRLTRPPLPWRVNGPTRTPGTAIAVPVEAARTSTASGRARAPQRANAPLCIHGAASALPPPSHRANATPRAPTAAPTNSGPEAVAVAAANERDTATQCATASPRALAAAAPPSSTSAHPLTYVDTQTAVPPNRPRRSHRRPTLGVSSAALSRAATIAPQTSMPPQGAGPSNELGRWGSIRVGRVNPGLCAHDPTACVLPIRTRQSAHGRDTSMRAGTLRVRPIHPNIKFPEYGHKYNAIAVHNSCAREFLPLPKNI
ncbi:hypothetical protein FIBSPDRAFT_937977 [Athelia psychrophila]|uniref:Uncharacterized protein n=1 Tax=Athelia psychrophila TaxID=1759441 RepID=A0A165ZFL6_9AGAM|nr:hypothetical protein FIBSPDRAFT_937977 [Fibularhizoctonia sp. CBS 109695]